MKIKFSYFNFKSNGFKIINVTDVADCRQKKNLNMLTRNISDNYILLLKIRLNSENNERKQFVYILRISKIILILLRDKDN